MPWALPVFAVGVVVALFVGPRIALRRGEPRVVVFLWLCAWFLVLAATLTPSDHAPNGMTFTEAMGLTEPVEPDLGTAGRVWTWALPNPKSLFSSVNWQSMNLLLFAPLGVAAGFIRSRGTRVWALTFALLTSLAVELIQYRVFLLGRSQFNSATVIIGWLGVLLGCAVGWAGAALWRKLTDQSHP